MTEGYALARYATQETGAMSIIVEITIVSGTGNHLGCKAAKVVA
jgi:hypothetical protein